jgi:hypothetical protein
MKEGVPKAQADHRKRTATLATHALNPVFIVLLSLVKGDKQKNIFFCKFFCKNLLTER